MKARKKKAAQRAAKRTTEMKEKNCNKCRK